MVESAKPVFGNRTWNISMALATVHVLHLRNCSNSAGVSRSEAMSSPFHKRIEAYSPRRSGAFRIRVYDLLANGRAQKTTRHSIFQILLEYQRPLHACLPGEIHREKKGARLKN